MSDHRADPRLEPLDVAIVGGGFAGTIVAVQLTRISPVPLRIVIFDRAGAFGRGAAYSPATDECLLNVRAKAMGAFPDAEDDFLRWLRAGGYGADDPDLGDRFLPRRLYGAYLSDLLDASEMGGSTVVRHAAEVRELIPVAEGYVVKTASGATWTARAAVIAVGNLPPGGFDDPALVAALSEYATNAWELLARGAIDRAADVVIIGTGLSALDVLATLAATDHRGRIIMLSRGGRFPLAHVLPDRTGPAAAVWSSTFAAFTGGPYEALRLLRSLSRDAVAFGATWHDVIDASRPHVNAIWQRWTPAQKQQFFRHLSGMWEIHRHRAPQALLSRRDAMIAAGRLHVIRGRFIAIARHGERLRLGYRGTSNSAATEIGADVVVDCRGPRRRFSPGCDAFVDGLLARNLTQPGPLDVGLRAAADGSLLGPGCTGPLYALGSPLRGTLLESSAVREIRVQARIIAAKIVARTSADPDRAGVDHTVRFLPQPSNAVS